MEHVTSRTPDDPPARSGRGALGDALGWLAFLVIVVVAVAAVIAGTIRGRLSPGGARVQPSLSGAPTPSPSPLPRPGPAPPGTMIA